MRQSQSQAEMIVSGKAQSTFDSKAFIEYKKIQDKLKENHLSLFFGETGTLKMIYNHPNNVTAGIRAFSNQYFTEYCTKQKRVVPK